jgi:hypothetical protein
MNDDLRKIVDIAIDLGGGVTKLGNALGIPRQNIQGWRQNGRIPAEWVRRVSEETKMTNAELRPDLFVDLLPPRGMELHDMIDELSRAEAAFEPIDQEGKRIKRAAAELVPLLWEMIA